MKIRTDFVTNSSSSSFVAINIYSKDLRFAWSFDAEEEEYSPEFDLRNANALLKSVTNTDSIEELIEGLGLDEDLLNAYTKNEEAVDPEKIHDLSISDIVSIVITEGEILYGEFLDTYEVEEDEDDIWLPKRKVTLDLQGHKTKTQTFN